MKNILITGGAGFIGSKLSLQLKKKGYEITVIDNLSSQIHGKNPETDSPLYKSIVGQVNFINGDVVRPEDWEKAIKGQDVIVHLAAETGTGQSMYQIEKYTSVNVSGTAKMLDLLVNKPHHVKKVIIASSRAVYGEGKYLHPELGLIYPKPRNVEEMRKGHFEIQYPDGQFLKALPTDEESKIHPTSIYGITKYTQEQMVMTACSSMGVAPVAVRFQNVYGEGQSLLNPYTGILSIFSSQILNGNDINVFEDGKESRDFIHVDDAVEAVVKCIENDAADGEVFNVGTGIPTDVITVAENLKKFYNRDFEINVSGQFRLGDIRHNFADISKIKSRLNFQPRISFEEGIGKFTNWVLQQNIRDVKFKESLEEMKVKGLLK
ncbi:NAD-dependent epimerase/dehydratase family protein [Chryseobacterium daecheongense]|uniref:NAD-dependent epimerase/dehydratase family protein n=1 Tax=Chryseobacterium daecheongense TaxID=192389 RepID=A0A3N0VXP8_9FLAO|nr:NAD-dependent epimerase/dehydratase family protein [Chryseobacterium daecheongense]ROH97596.1 NAD-dependent epimerase/dehydratase family protein [Chryseobacterium daecheongense]TDX93253.1 dTDP-L-rhamnose 4-epimerase [Chryseobacterium daecheongense]